MQDVRSRDSRQLYVQVQPVSCRRWKQDLQLNKKGKEGSRLLAIKLFPTAAELLKSAFTSQTLVHLMYVSLANGRRAWTM
jgi:hypothetical protein